MALTYPPSPNPYNPVHVKYIFFHIEIGVNLSDRMYQGEYNGSKKHEADLSCVLDRAWKSGIESMIITGGSLTDSSQAIELSKQESKHLKISH